MRQSKDNKFIPMTSITGGNKTEVKNDIFFYTNQIVNVVFIGEPGKKWVMIDAGMPKSAKDIIEVAEKRYGKNNPPAAIILTHGHFDHVGSIVDILGHWKVPVYAHSLEFPYLTGKRDYPKPDTSVEGGILAKTSFIYPHKAIDISPALQEIPSDSTVPELSGWEWLHTPGHTPGHISLYRKSDKTLISGDAFITVRQDSLYNVLIQKKEVNGPPSYLTTDWQAAWDSVRKLKALNPALVVPGHGAAMEGKELKDGLENLANNFKDVAIPDYGRFVNED